MSYILSRETEPEGLEIKTTDVIQANGGGTIVIIGDYVISEKDFIFAVNYFLTNTDLRDNDPRLQLVESIKSMEKVPGWNHRIHKDSARLQEKVPFEK